MMNTYEINLVKILEILKQLKTEIFQLIQVCKSVTLDIAVTFLYYFLVEINF